MRIGIDAKWYFTGPPSTRMVLENLLPPLLNNHPEHEWFLFLDKHDKEKQIQNIKVSVNLVHTWSKPGMLSNLIALPRLSKKHRIDVMVYQTFPGSSRGSRSIAFIHDVLFKSHPAYFSRKERLYFRPFARIIKKANRLVVTSNYVREELVKYHYAHPGNIDTMPLAAGNAFKPIEEQDPQMVQEVSTKLKLPDRYLLYAGRINVRKNIPVLLESIALLKDKEIKLVIVGKKDGLSVDLEKKLGEFGLAGRVIIYSGISTTELAIVYALSSLFCFPSLAEGFGLPPLEAMASGIPVVVSDRTAIPEVCGQAGSYVDPMDPEGLAKTIDRLLSDPVLYGQKKKEGLDQAKKFSWEKSGERLMESILNAVK